MNLTETIRQAAQAWFEANNANEQVAYHQARTAQFHVVRKYAPDFVELLGLDMTKESDMHLYQACVDSFLEECFHLVED